MKFKQKALIGSVISVLLLSAGVVLSNSAKPAVSAQVANEMTLAHNSYVYNKSGKRLSKFQGSKKKTYLKKGSRVHFIEKIEQIKNNDKQFYLLNKDNYHQSWLPYHQISGNYYYSIGSGAYVKATNVNRINDKPLYTKEATVRISKKTKTYTVGLGKDKTVIKAGKKYRVDRVTGLTTKSEPVINYRIKGTNNAFIPAEDLAIKPHQNLKLYTQATYISFLKKAGTYDAAAVAFPTNIAHATFLTGDVYPVEKLTYLWVPSKNKAELFYLLKDSWNRPRFYSLANYQPAATPNLTYIKADETSYFSGPYLKPNNTPEQAQDDAKIATKKDKQELQTLVNQETITPYQKSNSIKLCNFNFSYALQLAQRIVSSDKATIAAVKEATVILTKAQNDLLNCSPKQEKEDQLLSGTTPYLFEYESFV